MGFSDWLKPEVLLEILKSPKLHVTIFISGCVFLFLPKKIADQLSIDQFRNAHRPIIGVITVIAVCLLIVQIVIFLSRGTGRISSIIGSKISSRWNERTAQNEILKQLDTLLPGEHQLLARFLIENKQTIPLMLIDPAASSLMSKGFLKQGPSQERMACPYTIRDFVWNELQNRKDKFLSDPKNSLS